MHLLGRSTVLNMGAGADTPECHFCHILDILLLCTTRYPEVPEVL